MSKGARSGYESDELAEIDELHQSLTDSCETEISLQSSCYSSPMSNGSVKQLTKSFEDLLNPAQTVDTMGLLAENLKKLTRSRSGYKGRITRVIKAFDKAEAESTLDRITFNVLHTELNGFLNKYNAVDGEIQELYDEQGVDVEDSSRKKDIDESDVYLDGIRDKLIAYEKHVVAGEQQPVANNNNNDALVAAITQAQGTPSRQTITCQLFDGTHDQLDFKNWFDQFDTMISSGRPMRGKYKLISLRNHLTKGGLAFKLIKNLELIDDNYDVAVQILKDEFLDEYKIVEQMLSQILEKTPQYDSEFKNLRLYVAEIKGILSDLKTSHNVDLTTAGTGGYKFVSHIVFSKIPSVIQKIIIAEVKSNYSTLDHIFDKIKYAIETYNKTKSKKVEANKGSTGSNWKPSV